MAVSRRQSRSHFSEPPLSTIMESSREEVVSPTARVKESSSSIIIANTEALKCFVFDEDKYIFQHPLPFENGPAQFRVSKSNVSIREGGLCFIARGPGDAVVKVCDTGDDVERCEVIPATPGSYHLEILWDGKHIRGSPFSLVFKRTRTRILSDGLDLHDVKYRLGVEHRFKVDCSSLKEGKLTVTILPSSAATIEITNSPGGQGHPDSYQCRILPLEIGCHELAVTYSGKHIHGSPFHVQFNSPGDASKCMLIPSSTLHRIGNRVTFKVTTIGAGFGQLHAGVRDVTNNVPVDIHVTRTHTDDHDYTLDFDPGCSLECVLAVKYDNSHIHGSPFQLLFNQLASCTTEGVGLVSAQAGAWNKFSVEAEDEEKCKGALKVNVNRADGERVETVVSARTPLHFDVSYFPKAPGMYMIWLHWGDARVPGSPFRVSCYPASLVVVDRPCNDVTLGSCIQFKVQPLGSSKSKSLGVLRVSARDCLGTETVGYTSWQEDGSYSCTLTPERPGKYPINVKFNDVHVIGSPFVVTVVNSPNPNLVEVWGRGMSGTAVGDEGNFSVDISRAGVGLLSVSVRDHSDTFNIHTSRTPGGLIHVSYRCTIPGTFLMDVTWSGEHIPGSPFTVFIATEDYKSDHDGGLKPQDKHKMFLGNVTSVGINGDWLKVWRNSTRLRHRHTNGDTGNEVGHEGVELEEGLTYF